MHRIALRSLAHDRGKLFASLAGVAFAATLVLCQIGMYGGFLDMACATINHTGGDLWVMAKGTQVLENGETLSAGTKAAIASHPCVTSVRGLLLSFAFIRKPSGARDSVQLIGFDPGVGQTLPWSFAQGLPQDMHAPDRMAVDVYDLGKLQIPEDAIGRMYSVNDRAMFVGALTEGIRSFTLLPNVFLEITAARRLLGLAEGQSTYWVATMRDPSCLRDVTDWVQARNPDLEVHTTEQFVQMTQHFWVTGSGAGSALAFGAVLGLVVGTVIVAQTLYAITKEHLRELGTLKAIGATNAELIGFVGWQAAFLAVIGGGLGFAMAFGVQHLVGNVGLKIVLSATELSIGVLSIVFMCVVASVGSIRKVISVEAAEVFK